MIAAAETALVAWSRRGERSVLVLLGAAAVLGLDTRRTMVSATEVSRVARPDTDFDMMAVALVGAGEAIATRVGIDLSDQRGQTLLALGRQIRALSRSPSSPRSRGASPT